VKAYRYYEALFYLSLPGSSLAKRFYRHCITPDNNSPEADRLAGTSAYNRGQEPGVIIRLDRMIQVAS
jgi:hypothetical protein